MPEILLETQVSAPIERVFDLARSIDAHVRSTAGTGERAVAGRTTGLIGLGEHVTWEAKHLGLRRRLTAKITAYDRPNHFADIMISGPFKTMHHSHRFTDHDGGTRMTDTFTYTAPLGPLGRLAEHLVLTRYLRRFLADRNRVLKELAESRRWREYLVTAADATD